MRGCKDQLHPICRTAIWLLLVLHAQAATSFMSSRDAKTSHTATSIALDDGDDPQIDVYFGCGRFWHMQFAFAKVAPLAFRLFFWGSLISVVAPACYQHGGRLGVISLNLLTHLP